MIKNKYILIIFALFPLYAYICYAFFNIEHLKVTLIAFPIITVLSIFEQKSIKLERFVKIYLGFFAYTFFLDFTRGQVLSGGYYDLLSVLMLVYLSSIKIQKKTIVLLSKLLSVVILTSTLVIVIQATYDSTFMAAPAWIKRLGSFDEYTIRLSSYFTWINLAAPLFSFAPILAIILHNSIERRELILTYFYIILGFLFSFLTKGRALIIYVAIVTTQVFMIRGNNRIAKVIKYSILMIMLIICSYFILQWLDVDVEKIIFYRFLESERDFENTSAFARVDNFNFFINNLSRFWLLGSGYNLEGDLARSMDRKSKGMLIGVLDPFLEHGVIAFLLYLWFLIEVVIAFYSIARVRKNWSLLLGFAGFITSNLVSSANHIFHMGIILLFVYYYYYVTNDTVINNNPLQPSSNIQP